MARDQLRSPVRNYQARLRRLEAEFAALELTTPVRLAKSTSNVFRQRTATAAALDVSDFAGVLYVDRAARTADVLGMTTYDDLVAALLPHGFMPKVVPQLRTITLGGAVTGLGIESSSFRNGLPHESVVELDILTGEGVVVTARADNEHRDLFYGFPNSYGSLGYAVRLRIELDVVKPFVRLQHVPFSDIESFVAGITKVATTSSISGRQIDFVDGVVFGADEAYVTVGSFVEQAPYVSDYTGMQIYYRSIQQRELDYLTVSDYLWRWDTDWFWCSRAFGVQQAAVRRLVPKKYLRSDTYWKAVNFARRHGITDAITDIRRQPRSEPIVQDVELPSDRSVEFLTYFNDTIGISPVWVCPLKQRDRDAIWELYRLDPDVVYLNIGFWSGKSLPPGEGDGYWNRQIEGKVSELGGRKSLYSTAYYEPDEFWRLYNGPIYDVLKKTYDPDDRFPNLFDKTVGRR